MKKSVILCVDDEKMVLSSLKSELKEAFGNNYIIEVCEDPAESLEILKELLEEGYEVPLIISDYVMPIMKGDELLKNFHHIVPETHKIMLTGQATTEGVTNAVNWARLYRYIGKPWESRDLCLTVKEAIRSYNQERQLMKQFNQLKVLNEGLEQKVKERTSEIEHKNELLNKKQNELKVINQSITDSIHAASTIQQALLPTEKILKEYFNEFFVMYKPKDIVSGDFYWVKKIDHCICIAAADCTGHGVPGAFMSMLGISMLNDIATSRLYCTPAAILNELRERIKNLLNQDGENFNSKEGMDIAFCIINTETKKLHFSGAYNPLYLIRKDQDNQHNIIELKADRMPIGVHPKDEQEFQDCMLDIEINDTIYLFSDGFTSQFGGEKGKKIMNKKFQEILISIQDYKMQQQKCELESFFETWKQEHEQVDDVLVMGLQIDKDIFEIK